MLYIVLRHPNDTSNPWKNSWSSADSNVIEAITTTAALAKVCKSEKHQGNKVSIYRCAFGNIQPAICCIAGIDKADPVGYVTFKNQVSLEGVEPPTKATQNKLYFYAEEIASFSKAA